MAQQLRVTRNTEAKMLSVDVLLHDKTHCCW